MVFQCDGCGASVLGPLQPIHRETLSRWECRCGQWNDKFPPLVNRIETDQRTVAERRWHATNSRGRVAQQPCDIGLFSDDSKQGRLI